MPVLVLVRPDSGDFVDWPNAGLAPFGDGVLIGPWKKPFLRVVDPRSPWSSRLPTWLGADFLLFCLEILLAEAVSLLDVALIHSFAAWSAHSMALSFLAHLFKVPAAGPGIFCVVSSASFFRALLSFLCPGTSHCFWHYEIFFKVL